MLVNAKGTQIAHPLLSASMNQANSIQALTRTLGLSASQRGLSGSEQATRNKADKTARDAIKKAQEDSLLA
jgi:dihydroxyacid dehydratase/phosphogluconate dehydratase